MMERKKPKDVIPQPYAKLFENYEYFNEVQSTLLNDLLYTDKSIVLSAPTGSGKTVAFELAIVRLLQQTQQIDRMNNTDGILPKAIYIAPIKALCSEKFDDWRTRFGSVGVNCAQLTGDTESGNIATIAEAQIVISTPEKWDSLTRRWRDFNALLPAVQLFIVDEVHLLNEDTRGPILEAIVARMKSSGVGRFIVASATIPNVQDLTSWIRSSTNQVSQFTFSEIQQPVPLEKHVLGFTSSLKGFQFDMKLNYQLPGILRKFSENKAALIFCSSRKSAEMAAFHLNKGTPPFELTYEQKNFLNQMAKRLMDIKLRKLFENGIAYHHAGLQYADRGLIESSFRQGSLMLLLSTSTLAMGINLPARLVVIKSTEYYIRGSYTEYPENMLLQMIGRAGRPQYDTKGIAVILTQNKHVEKYRMLVNGKAPIESHLHKHLAEHLNSQISLNTITNLEVAMNWVRSTYLYVRAVRNPTHYGLEANLKKDFVERKLEELCLKHINALNSVGLVTLSHVNGLDVETTAFGKLMAKFYLCFETIKLFRQLNGNETLSDILNVIVKCKELSEFMLRVNEKKVLNELNKFPIRFPIKGRVKKYEDKISCLIQAVLGNIEIPAPGLIQESLKIMRISDRVAKCLLEYIRLCVQKNIKSNNQMDWYGTLLNALTLAKCFHAKLWENSEYACKQLHGIGNVYSNLLVNAGKTTLKSIAKTDARTIEMLLNKPAPFGDEVLQNLITFPEYEINLMRCSFELLLVSVKQINECYAYKGGSLAVLIVGDSFNNILLLIENLNAILSEFGYFERKIKMQNPEKVENVHAHVVHTNLVGVDVHDTLEINPTKKDEKSIKKPTKKQKRQSRLNLTANEISNNESFEGVSGEKKLPGNSNSNVGTEVCYTKLQEFSYKKNKIQNIESMECSNEVDFLEESIGADNKIINETAMTLDNSNLSKATQRKLTDFFMKRKKGAAKLGNECETNKINKQIKENVVKNALQPNEKLSNIEILLSDEDELNKTGEETFPMKIISQKTTPLKNQKFNNEFYNTKDISEIILSDDDELNEKYKETCQNHSTNELQTKIKSQKKPTLKSPNFNKTSDLSEIIYNKYENVADPKYHTQKSYEQHKLHTAILTPQKRSKIGGSPTAKKSRVSFNSIAVAAEQHSLPKKIFSSNEIFLRNNMFNVSAFNTQKSLPIQYKKPVKLYTSSVPITLASFLGDMDKDVSIEAMLAQMENSNTKSKQEITVHKNPTHISLLNDSLLSTENNVTPTAGPLDLSKYVKTMPKLSQRSKSLLPTTQNLTAFDTQSKFNSTQVTENEYILWYKVALQFRKLPRHALTLSNFRSTYHRVLKSLQEHGNVYTTDSIKSNSNSTSSKRSYDNFLKSDSGIEPVSSSFRLKLFEENDREHMQRKAFGVKLINQNIMNFMLDSKCKNRSISDTLDELEKEMDISLTQSSIGIDNFFDK